MGLASRNVDGRYEMARDVESPIRRVAPTLTWRSRQGRTTPSGTVGSFGLTGSGLVICCWGTFGRRTRGEGVEGLLPSHGPSLPAATGGSRDRNATFERCLLVGEVPEGAHRPTESGVQRLDRVGRDDDPSDLVLASGAGSRARIAGRRRTTLNSPRARRSRSRLVSDVKLF